MAYKKCPRCGGLPFGLGVYVPRGARMCVCGRGEYGAPITVS